MVNRMNVRDRIERAQSAIAAILDDLEKTTGERVADVSIREIDVTTLTTKGRAVQAGVIIKLETPRERHWA